MLAAIGVVQQRKRLRIRLNGALHVRRIGADPEPPVQVGAAQKLRSVGLTLTRCRDTVSNDLGGVAALVLPRFLNLCELGSLGVVIA